MRVKPLNSRDEIIEQVIQQLKRFMMSDQRKIKWLENESQTETEYPIRELAAQMGYHSTGEFLEEELYDYVDFVGSNLIQAGRLLYDTPELNHLVSLHARTETKERRNGRGGGYGGRGGGRAGNSYSRNFNNRAQPQRYQQQQPPTNYSSSKFQPQQRQQRPSPPLRKYSPPSEDYENRRPLPQNWIPTERNMQPSSAKPSNTAPQPSSSVIKPPSPPLIAGPPPGFENLIQSGSSTNTVRASSASLSKTIVGDDQLKSVKTEIPSKNSSPNHRPPPDPKNARFEEAQKEFVSAPPGFSYPQNDTSDEEDEEFYDALEEQDQPIELPPCLSFEDSEKREYGAPILCRDIATETPEFNEDRLNKCESVDVDNYLTYFVNVITAIHYNIPSKKEVLYYEVINNLPEPISYEPGYDAASIFTVIKALGLSFMNFAEKCNVKDDIPLIYVKNVNRGMKKEEYRILLRSTLSFLMPKLSIPDITDGTKLTKSVIYESRHGKYFYFLKASSTKGQEKKMEEMLRKVKTLKMVNPYPRALCIFYDENRKPYRAQIIAQLDESKINVELVDVGEFLTVTKDSLKVVESNELAGLPRFAIPCRLEDDTKPVMKKALDGFERRSTSKSVAMYLTQKKNYVSIKLI